MKHRLTPLKHFILVTAAGLSFLSHAINSTALEKQADVSITALYHTLNSMPNKSMVNRIDWFSKHFSGLAYELGSLGEGADSPYDQFPLYRTDAFDCDTYVNTVLALALANSLPSFQQCIKQLRYKDGKATYINRNHFTSLDWNINNQKKGFFKDITLTIKNKQQQPVALISTTLINKSGWYNSHQIDSIRLLNKDEATAVQRLADLKKEGSQLKSAIATIAYLPLTALFPHNNEPDLYLFSQIPNGAIIEIVRPDWDLRKEIGTALDVSHLGFAIRRNDQLYFRQASSVLHKIVDVPLVDYLKQALNSPTIKGINVQIVLPARPLDLQCKI